MIRMVAAQLPILSGVPPDLVARYPHLRTHLTQLDRRVASTLVYLDNLPRELRMAKVFNVIYPVGGPIFIHLRSRGRERPLYSVISPMTQTPREILTVIEEAIAPLIAQETDFEGKEEHQKILNEALDQVILIDDSLEDFEYVVSSGKQVVQVYVNNLTADAVRNSLILDKVYMGVLEPFLRDQYVEDLSCDGLGPVFVEHKIFGSCESNVIFREPEDLDAFILGLSERIGRPVNYRRPIVDATLPDGSRINMVYGTDISRRGSNFTIRKFSEKPVSIADLIAWNTLSSLEAAYLWIMMEHGMNIWFCGETASGKTTALRAASVFINPRAKIVSIEDTPEIVVPHDNWIREVTRQGEEAEHEVSLFTLLKAALRQRPNNIIVGEIRGQEASVAFQAMQTGHTVLSTFHAGSVEKLIQRLTGDPINIPKTYVDILNCVVIQSAVRIPATGRIERRFLSINEFVGYDPVAKRFDYGELFSWNPATDRHEFRGEGNSYLLENKIRTMMGLTPHEVRKIYDDMFTRARILELLIEKKVTGYHEIWNMVKLAYEVGVHEILERLEAGERIWLE